MSPDCKGIFQDLKALKVISPAVSEDILLAEAVFAHNSKLGRSQNYLPSNWSQESSQNHRS